MREVGVEVEFREEEVWKDGEKMEKEWAGCWAELKKGMQNGYTEKLKNDYKKKGMQSQVFAGQENESLVWLNTNIAEDDWNHGFTGADGGHSGVERVAWDRRRGRKM